jgi:hypothetical protein
MARFLFFTYVAMIACAIPFVSWFGIRGFLFLWLITETAQIVYTVELNHRLFREFSVLEIAPLYRLSAVIGLGTLACWWIVGALHGRPVLIQLSAACLFAALLLAIEFPIYGLSELGREFAARFTRRALREELTPAV